MPTLIDEPRWYVLRDLKRSNAKVPGYRFLSDKGIDVFTPMHWVVRETPGGTKSRRYEPFMPSLLFARSAKSDLDGIIDRTDTLQYRFVKGAPQHTPMTVPDGEMETFKRAVTTAYDSCIYYTPDEITSDMLGKRVKIVGGMLDGTIGCLLKKRGARRKRLILEIKDMLVASVEFDGDYVTLV